MLVLSEIPFRFVETEGFKEFCNVACPKFDIPSRITIAQDVYQMYVDEKKLLKSTLMKSSQRVSLTTNTWTSLQNINYMVLMAYFVDSKWILQKRILNFCQVPNHKGETIGKVIGSCLLDWGIDEVFSTTIDNATSNDSAISYTKSKLKIWKSIILDGELLHMRCAHIMNLIVNDRLKELHDSVASVRNVVRYVRSPKRLKNFLECAGHEKIESKALLSRCVDKMEFNRFDA